ncbi:unnamed protein product [Medioppia subpectinata]|uniref:Tudor domain-containing protein n=1 Tax=Medioppia subpectinata TaxID=1979941 RepID=A0A7R9Q1E1_9ACAR|nr:unnamed protein product [Medioppia subpectinata]CAG2108443.1 unnamed protein product [Medioppia subpectinata]
MNVSDSGANRTVSPLLGARIVRICHKYPNKGIELHSILYYFHKEFLYPLDLMSEGFDAIEPFIQCLICDNYPLEVIDGSDGWRRLAVDKRRYYYWLSGVKVAKRYDMMNILADIPDDAIACGHQLPKFQLPANLVNALPEILSGNILNELCFCEMRLMYAISPHEMFVHICDDDHHLAYHRLRIDMRSYDNVDNEDKYRVPSLLLFDGLLCAVRYHKICHEWHRSIILSIDRDNNCRLLLVDIGDVIEANAKHLRLLLQKYAQLPAQALKVQLTGIRPIGKSDQHWSQWAKNFVKRLEEHNYCGPIECAFIGRQSDRYRVFIRYYDKIKSINENDLLFLHQILVDKQLAIISGNDMPID